MLRRLYDRTIELAGHRHAVWWLLALAVVEASLFPVPVEALLLPMVFAAPARAWLFVLVATAGTVAGGLIGYGIGILLYESVAEPVLSFYGYGEAYHEYAALYGEWGAWIVVAGGFTPIPYKVVTIASGAMHLDPWVFVVASVASRGLRFGIEAALLAWFGPPVRAFVERHLGLAAAAALIAVVAGFAAIEWFL